MSTRDPWAPVVSGWAGWVNYHVRSKARFYTSRWFIVSKLGRIDRLCWADLCSWAANGHTGRHGVRDLWDIVRGYEGGHHYQRGYCYCGRPENGDA